MAHMAPIEASRFPCMQEHVHEELVWSHLPLKQNGPETTASCFIQNDFFKLTFQTLRSNYHYLESLSNVRVIHARLTIGALSPSPVTEISLSCLTSKWNKLRALIFIFVKESKIPAE